MIEAQVIIVGGGPAGAACAWKLNQSGMSTIVLDKKDFPRSKLCAGWISPGVLKDLRLQKEDYPYGLLTFRRLNFHVYGRTLRVGTCQFSIRRIQFDHWLLKRARVPVHRHTVQKIRRENDTYIIDEAFRSRYLVGAGGTHCPVYRAFFKDDHPRKAQRLITTVEEEFQYDRRRDDCHLWFFENNLPGYAWYVPKADGYLNVGIGAKFSALKNRRTTIRHQWDYFTHRLSELSMVQGHTYRPRGYNYYLRQPVKNVQRGRAYVVGDAAGLATLDMGEGIGPAVKSGILCARAIFAGHRYSAAPVARLSLTSILWAGAKSVMIKRRPGDSARPACPK